MSSSIILELVNTLHHNIAGDVACTHFLQTVGVSGRPTPGQLCPVLQHLNEASNGFSTVSFSRRSGNYSVWV